MLKFQLALTFLPGIGDITAKKLVAYCGSAEAVFSEKQSLLTRIPGIGETIAEFILLSKVQALNRAEQEMAYLEKSDIRPLFFLDSDYPFRLKNCIDGPVMLYMRGRANLNAARVVSIVGTRSATDYGRELCDRFVAGLAAPDMLIVSGLAYGIDGQAHKAALNNNIPTVGVVAHGHDRLYPPLHKSLAEKMLGNGALLTDFPSGTIPEKENFPKRNRIIAGMADAVLIIEAAKKGGALITGEIANSYSRDVFAVPGRVGDVYSEGCNYFIKINKAALAVSADDIKYIMGWDDALKSGRSSQQLLFPELKPEEEKIVELLRQSDELSIDELCIDTGIMPGRMASLLLNLEFSGLIKCLPGKVYRLIR
jgi:DNA processing protein